MITLINPVKKSLSYADTNFTMLFKEIYAGEEKMFYGRRLTV